TGTADANGNLSFPATIPAGLAPGTYTLTVSCGNGGVARMTIEVGLTDASGGPVAETGSNTTIPFTRLGIAAIAAGGLILAVSRRHRAAGARAR
ncbi:MAG TPA: hypothetical protein VMQ81_05475, partial [Acidimicrobiia bacterium]|nr:hypothetical protein [Acidimicrobiia bacterium]